MKNIKFKQRRITAALLALVMIITSLPIDLLAYAADGVPNGIGVINNMSSPDDDAYSNYRVKFYDKDGAEISHSEFTGTPTIAADGSFTLTKNQQIDLLSISGVSTFIDNNKIKRVEIEFLPIESSNPKTYHFYSASPSSPDAEHPTSVIDSTNTAKIIYTIINEEPVLDDNNKPIIDEEEDPKTGEIIYKPRMKPKPVTKSDYQLATVTSTEKIEHPVDVYWHDTGENRPDLTFTIKQNGTDMSTAPPLTSDSPVTDNSNHDIYNYIVPYADASGNKYNYTSEIKSVTEKGKAYRYESDGANNKFDFYSKRTFDFDIDWHQGTNNTALHTEEEIKDYILNNFELFDETSIKRDANGNPLTDENGNIILETVKLNDIDASRITITGTQDENGKYTGKVSISISGLDQITSDGHAKAYYLQPKTDDNGDLIESISAGRTGDDKDDMWKISAENLGVNSSEIHKVYQGGTVSNVITGKESFSANIVWNDGTGTQHDARIDNAAPGNVVLWRYANISGNNQESDKERTAQAASTPLVKTDGSGNVYYKLENGTELIKIDGTFYQTDGTTQYTGDTEKAKPVYLEKVEFDNLEKYDRFGNPYVYYAKEQLSGSLKDYEAVYSQNDHADDEGTITNKLAGTRNFVVEAEWKAAARQGGTATVVYQVQRQKADGTWETIEVPNLDEYGNMLDSNGNITTDEASASKEGKLIIRNFQAETMTKTAQFAPLPKYNADGTVINYKIVQVEVDRTDDNQTTKYTTPVEETITDPTVELNQYKHDEYTITVENPYQNKEDNYKFTYQLVGEISLNIIKHWDDTAYNKQNPAKLLDHTGQTVNAMIERMNFGSTQFVQYKYEDDDEIDEDTDCVTINSGNSLLNPGVNVAAAVGSGENIKYILEWERTISVPMYDDDGHEYQYQVKEVVSDTFNMKNYTVWVTYDKPTNTYTIENVYTTPGGPSMDFSKEWQDDGDLLHRASVFVHYTDDVSRTNSGGGGGDYDPFTESGASGTKEVDEPNSWKGRIGKLSDYTYDSNHFGEYNSASLAQDDYTQLNHIYYNTSFTATATISGLTPNSDYKVLKKSGGSAATSEDKTTDANGTFTVDVSNTGFIKIQKKVTDENNNVTWETVTTGFTVSTNNPSVTATLNYNHDNDYYPNTYNGVVNLTYNGGTLIKQSSTGETYNGKAWIDQILASQGSNSSDKESLAHTDINFVSFDNLVGLYKNGEHWYAVEQTVSSSNPSLINFKNTRVGVVSYKVVLDWKVGGWDQKAENASKKVKVKITPRINGNKIDADGNPITGNSSTAIPLTIKKDIPVTKSEFYLTDLPKYDNKGNIIEWELEEIEIDETVIQSRDTSIPGVTERYCQIDGKDCVVSVSGTVYDYSNKHHTDDLITVTLTNQFVGETEAKVNKMWYDDNNALDLRSDTYLQLWYKSTDPTNNTVWTQLGGDYVWKATQETEWSYVFENLPEFDDKGYPYEYAIRELDIPDYSTALYSNYNVSEDKGTDSTWQATTSNNVTYDVVPSNGWFVDRISGEVKINGEKLWNNISPVLTNEHYPIAEISLYRRDKYRKNQNGTYQTDAQGNKVLTNDDDATNDADKTKIGQTKIYSGQKTFIFNKNKQWSIKDENNVEHTYNHEVIDGYYVKDGTDPKVDTTGTIVLPKFDDDGALIDYTLKENSINGYVFEISKDKIVNEYKGGRPLEITVTKTWDNMDNVKYPTVKLILHQIMFATTMNQAGTDYVRDSNGIPVRTPIEYNTYEKILRKDDGNDWTYTFGALNNNGTRVNPKEDIRQFAPDGECFAYFITEEIINSDTESRVLNALDKDIATAQNATRPDDGYLGDFYKANEIYTAVTTASDAANTFHKYYIAEKPYARDDGLGFKVKAMSQPAPITNTGTDECTSENINTPIIRTASIENSYEPDVENFKGKLIVNKTWNNHDASTENALNTAEFGNVKDYAFTVSRKTKDIEEKELFKVNTSGTGGIPEVTPINDANYFHYTVVTPMGKYNSSGQTPITDGTIPDAYCYKEVLRLNKTNYSSLPDIDVTIIIHKRSQTEADYSTMHNKVEIKGLAIYAQDAVRYTYKIDEDMTGNAKAYKNEANPVSSRMKDKDENGNPFLDENGDPVTKAEFTLNNELKVFTLNLYKVFGKKYTPEGSTKDTVQKLDPADYYQYFNDDFVLQNENIEFKLWQKKEGDTGFKAYKYGGNEYHRVARSGSGSSTVYKKAFTNLPKYSPDGKKYIYQVTEKIPPEGSKYTVLYWGNNETVALDQTSPIEVDCDDDSATYRNTYVRNVFEAKQINVNKYWDDNGNADGMRPTSVNVTINEEIPANNEANSTLQNQQIDKELENSNNWTKKVELPKYYYNGAIPIGGLEYGITESQTNLTPVGYKDPTYTYMTSHNGTLQTFSLENNQKITVSANNGTELEELNVYNSKDPVNSKLTFDKQWDDLNNKWSLRPDHIYVKVVRDSKDVITVNATRGLINIPKSYANNENKVSVQIRGLAKNQEYKVQRAALVNNATEWQDVTFTSENITDTLDDGTTTVESKTISFELTEVTNNTTQLKLLKKDGDNWVPVTADAYGKTPVAIINDDVNNLPVTTDNSGYTLGVKDTEKFTVTNGSISVPKAKAIDNKVGVLATGLDKYSADYTYKIYQSDDNNNFTDASEITVTKNATGRNTVSLTATTTGSTGNVYLKVKRSVDSGSETEMNPSSDFSGVRVKGGTLDSNTGIITVKAGESVLIEELPQKCAYDYKVYDGGTEMTSGVEVRSTTNSEKVDVLAVLDNVTADKTLTIKRSVNGGDPVIVTTGVTAYRFFAADSNTGVVALPVNTGTTDAQNSDNPKRVFENLSLGKNTGDDEQNNGTWQPYYYTILECDKYGYDVNSRLTSSQKENTAGDNKVTSSVDLNFKINVTDYKDGRTDARKHINIKVTRVSSDDPVTTDINGKPLRITVNGEDFYASNSQNNTPVQGVIVIPVSSDEDYVEYTVHDLPYAPSDNFNAEYAYSYTVKRCKAGGNDHGNHLVFVQYDGNKDYLITENETPAKTTVTYKKTWDKYAVEEGLKPNYIHLKLFRTYTDGSGTVVTENVSAYNDSLKNIDVSGVEPKDGSYTYNGTIDNLDAGIVVNRSSDSVGIFRKYTYFLKEYYDDTCTDAVERPGSTTYEQFTQTNGEDKPFILQTGNTTAKLAEGIENTLTTTKHDVTKKWIDNDDEEDDNPDDKPKSRDDYYVVLQRRAGVEGAWENVDLNNTIIETVTGSGDNETAETYTNEEVKTVGEEPNTYTILKVEKDELHIRFDKLPYCASNGAPYQYRAAEVQIGNDSTQQINENKTYLFLVPGTEPNDEDYSYVRIVHRGSNNYFVTYNYDPDYVDPDNPSQSSSTNYVADDYDYSDYATKPTKIVNKIVNPITFSHIKVVKDWDDEDNVYGKRPEKITFRLRRTQKGDIDTTFDSRKTVGETDNWSCQWEQLAAFAANGDRFEYFVEELPVAGYTTSTPTETATTDNGETTRVLTFKNTYVPEKKTLNAEKLWEDFSNKYSLRPGSVTYELWCKYDEYSGTNTTNNEGKVTGRTYDKTGTYFGPVYNSTSQSQVYYEIAKYVDKLKEKNELESTVNINNSSYFKNTVNGSGNKWETTFGQIEGKSILPAWINPTADVAVTDGMLFNGKAVEVTYYIVETFGDNDSKVKKIYNCEASNKLTSTGELTAGTSKDSWVLEKGLVYNTAYSKDGDGVYTVPQSIAVDGKLHLMVRDLPIADKDGNKYTYSIQETDSSGNSTTGHGLSIYNSENQQTNKNENSTYVNSTNGAVVSKQKQETTDLYITANNCTDSNGSIYFKLTCKKTVVDERYANDLSTSNCGSGLTFNTSSQVFASTNSHSAGDLVMKVVGLPRYDNGKEYTYEVVEYGSDNVDEAVPLSLSDENKKLSVTKKEVNSSDNTKVDLEVTKKGSLLNQKIYFRIKRKTSTETGVTDILNDKTVHPMLIVGADENPVYKDSKTVDGSPVLVDSITSDNLGVNTSGDYDYQKNVLIENNIICLITDSSTSSASLIIKGLPKYNPHGFAYKYEVVEYNGYSPSAAAKESTTIQAVPADVAESNPAKVNITVTKNSTTANEKVCFRLKRSVEYTQANGLGNFTVLKSTASSGTTASIQNTLNTRNIIVALDWNDNDYLDGVKIANDDANHPNENAVNKLHYPIDVRLSCDSLKTNPSNSTETYTEKKTIAVTNKTETSGKRPYTVKYGVAFKDLPKYDSNGTPYEYSMEQKIKTDTIDEDVYKQQIVDAYSDIEEKSKGENATAEILLNSKNTLGSNIAESKSPDAVTLLEVKDGNSGTEGRKYGYGATYTSYTDKLSGTNKADYVTQYNILNTLPLTAVQVVKHWDDDSNKFDLRPAVPTGEQTDPLGLVLETSLDGNTWAAPDYMLSETAAQRIVVDNDNNTWTYTFKKLLKTDDQNHPYQFKVTEKPGGNVTNVKAYKMPNYDVTFGDSNAKQTITADLDSNGDEAWDGTNPLTTTMDITNQLDTRDIKVTKTWADNGYPDALTNQHYDIAVTLSNTSLSCSTEGRKDSNNKYSETKILAKNSTDALVFLKLPKYNSAGDVISYSVKESLPTGSYSVASGDSVSSEKETATNVTATEFTAPTNADRKFGYVGTCTKVADNNIVSQYDITNTLPLTAVQAVKTWDDQSNAYGLRPNNITFELKTKAVAENSLNDTAFTGPNVATWSDPAYKEDQTVDKTTTANKWIFEYRKLLKYDASNNPYIFRIEEKFADSETHLKAYKEPTYTKRTVTAVEVNNPDKNATAQLDWDGIHPLVEQLEVKNTLDTRDIIVTKAWVDNGNTATRYKLAITLSNNKTSNTETKYLAANETKGLKFKDVPIYDSTGQKITYKVKEAFDNDNTHEVATGDNLGDKVTGGTISDAVQTTEFEVGRRIYGYVGSCKKITKDDIVVEFDITNKLPMITFEAKKEWKDENNRDYKRPTSVSFNLQRKIKNYPENQTEIAAMPEPEKNEGTFQNVTQLAGEDRTASYKNGDTTYWTAKFGLYPQYSVNNYEYEYQVLEITPDSYTSTNVLGSDTTLTDETATTQKNYTFTNTNKITEQKLTVEKKWVDDEFRATTRPTNLSDINVELWCKYTKLDGTTFDYPVNTDTELKAHIDKAYKTAQNNESAVYKYKPTLSDFTEAEDKQGTTAYNESLFISTYDFKYLPVYINVDGSAVKNGDKDVKHWQAVTYYVKETYDDTGSNIAKNYDDYYSAPETGTPPAKVFKENASYNETGTNLLVAGTNLDVRQTEDKTIYIENRLKTRDIEVDKTWADSDYKPNNQVGTLRYDIDVTLACADLSTTADNRHDSNNKYSETKTIVKNATTAQKFENLPMYKNDGTELVYTITEAVHSNTTLDSAYASEPKENNDSTAANYYNISVTNHKYGYVGSCTAEKNNGIVEKLHITNTLPLTAVEVEKTWNDAVNGVYDAYYLRPDVPGAVANDPLNLTLTSRKSGTSDSWTAPVYSVKSLPTESGDKSKWTYTYTKLLKYTEDNVPYSFRIEEGTVPNGYKLITPYTKQTLETETELTTLKNSATVWNGTNVLATPLQVTNELDTRDIIVTKTWKDHDYSGANDLHYNLAVTMTGTIKGEGETSDSSLQFGVDSSNNNAPVTSLTKVLAANAATTGETPQKLNLIFKGLPKYDKNGNVIVYNITEAKTTQTGSTDSDDVTTTTKSTTGTNYNVEDAGTGFATFTQASYNTDETKGNNSYGYIGTCKYISNYDGTDTTKKYVEQFDITNELPLTNVEITKTWKVDDDYHTYSEDNDRKITFTVTRSPETDNDSEKPYSNVSENVVCTNGITSKTTLLNQLVYNYENTAYTYSVAETPVKGYITDYPTNPDSDAQGTNTAQSALAVKDATETLKIRNTQKTGNVKIQKIDYTYYAKHKLDNNYADEKLNGAVFELYLKDDDDNDVAVPVKLAEDSNHNSLGYYVFDILNTAADKNVVISKTVDGKDGIIDIRGLPLNTYYLKEKTQLNGFKPNTTEYSFKVDVDSSNEVTTDFTLTPATENTEKSTTNTKVYNNDGFINYSGELPKIGNEETPRKLKLIKEDADDGRKLEGATYYLLYLIPYRLNGTGYADEPDYKDAAVKAIKDSKGQYTSGDTGVEHFWTIENRIRTDSSGIYQTEVAGLLQNLDHGVYTLLEVQAPVGYDLNNNGFSKVEYTLVDQDTNASSKYTDPTESPLLITLDRTHIDCEITHKDPRKDAKVKIYKQDEFENPLNGATFDLYYDPPSHEVTPPSDFDYIFFTDNKYYKYYNNELLNEQNPWGNVYATFYDSSQNKIGETTELNTYWINDENGGDKVKPPTSSNPKYVVFSNNSSQNDKITNKIEFTLGYGYFKVGSNTSNGITTYAVNDVDAENWDLWNYAKTDSGNIKYNTYGDCIYIKDNSSFIGLNKDFDDLHICFYNDSNQIVGLSPVGYLMPETVNISNENWYKFEVPIGATKFDLNNGNKDLTKSHYKRTAAIGITPDTGYQLVNNSGTYSVQACAYEFSSGTTTPTAFTAPIKIATVVTGDDGLPESVKYVNNSYAKSADDGKSVELLKWGSYYWKEVKSPTGYNAKPPNTPITFTVGAYEADKVVNVYKAANAQIKGEVTLHKTAQEKVGTIDIGADVPGATFELHKQSDNSVVKISVDNANSSVYNVNNEGSDKLTTDSTGGFKIKGLDWGQYYLQEVEPAPTGFKVNSTPVYFTVGRNNLAQTLEVKDPAAKAKIKITKTIDERIEAWGDPTFIFKLRQTQRYVDGTPNDVASADQRVKLVSLTLESGCGNPANGLNKATGDIEVEPGTYEVTEVKVARYEFNSTGSTIQETSSGKVTNYYFSNDGKATFTIAADGAVTVNYNNKVAYYDKFSHVNCKVNNFHGYKGIRVEYTTPITPGENDAKTINKSDLKLYRIESNGKEVEITDAAKKNALTLTYESKSNDDSRFSSDFHGDSGNIFTINNVSRYTDSVYKLKARDSNGFECDFDISFESKNQQTKKYEKTVVFKADDKNKSYFTDEGVGTSQYALTFTMVEGSETGTYKVYCVKHNGKVLASGDAIVSVVNEKIGKLTAETSPVLTVNEAYAYNETSNPTGLVFDKWNDLPSVNYSTFSGQLTTNDSNSVITYTAKLKQYSDP